MTHSSTFDYLKPTDQQVESMRVCREAASQYAKVLEDILPAGPDKTYAIRKLREVSMWAMVTLTRNPDGTPRSADGEK